MARILLGVSGGIAAYKTVELVRLAMRAGHSVRVVQTEASTRFVGPATFAGITGAPVLLSEWEADPLRGAFPGEQPPAHAPLSHLALAERADVYLIAPASANTLAKLAHGAADNLLTAAALACRAPLVVAPAMNGAMWEHPATQANAALLRERGARVLEPGTGALASIGEHGTGRLPEPPELLAAVEAALAGGAVPAAHMAGLRVLVTAGGTREPIDAVRYVGNRSSGRMGYALAREAARRGAEVVLVAANVALDPPPGVEVVPVRTAAELAAACEERFDATDVLLMAAAVADFRPADPDAGKIKKDQAGPDLALRMERTQDVLATLAARRRPGQVLVGFAAEHGEGALAHARAKRERKGLDAVVLNDVANPEIGFDVHENEVVVITAAQERHVPRADKSEVAGAILDTVLSGRSSLEGKVPR
jgi:phosphopantothenoylcysteine decarboxylase/phosphopantothenate--cysteine ligase